jgi:hypothetical protein
MVKVFTVPILSLFFSSDHNALIIKKTRLIGALGPGSAKQKLIRDLMLTTFTSGTSVMGANQNISNINNIRHCQQKKLIICEIVFCGLATRSVNVAIEMPIAENSIRYRAAIDRN